MLPASTLANRGPRAQPAHAARPGRRIVSSLEAALVTGKRPA